MNKPLEWTSRSRVRLAAAGRFQCPTSATHLVQLSASHHHLCSSCYHVDLHSSSLLRIDAHRDVVVSPHTDTHHSIVLLPVSSPTHVFCMRCVLPGSLRFAHCVLPATSYKAPSPRVVATLVHGRPADLISVGRPVRGVAAIRVVLPNPVSVFIFA